MGSMFRNEEMVLLQLFVQPEAAYHVISEIGERGCVQFRDLNENLNSFQRRFVNEVKRCNEMERKLRYIEEEVRKDLMKIPDVREIPNAPNPREIIDLEAHIEKTESEINELSASAIRLKSNFLELTEFKHILDQTQGFFNERAEANALPDIESNTSNPKEQTASGGLGFVTGVIKRERMPAFERMLWRISRGNIFLKQAEISKPLEDPATGNEYHKTVFAAFYQGEQLNTKIKKVCSGFHASLYPCPETISERNNILKDVRTRLEDLNLILNQTRDHRQRVLGSVAKELPNWNIMVSKMKAIYHTLNCFSIDVSKKCLIGECWVPINDISVVQKALTHGAEASGSSIPSFLNVIETKEEPPTFTRTNKFTRGFQNLIESYGIATYREVNPGLYTIITFPFLFALMFGDCGHAIIMLAFGLWMVISEKKLAAQKIKNEIFSIFFAGRYIILLMGIFSFYTGVIYNDLFSKSMNIFGSRWFINKTSFNPELTTDVDFLPKANYDGTPYFFGIDPVWQPATNKIIFLNSFKMKLSIIFGVTHMIFGVCVGIFNFVHFRKYSSIFLEFLPQIFLLIFLFLYLVIMIFMKWIMYSGTLDGWDLKPVNKQGTSCAPSVLLYFINMIMMGESTPNEDCDTYMYDGQEMVQRILIVGTVICIPILFLGKPLFIMSSRKKHQKKEVVGQNGDLNKIGDHKRDVASAEPEEQEEPMSDIFIHQAIHTIEFTLSTISHTASYLRLWALSLAHAQLSDVLWTMVFRKSLVLNGYVGCVAIYIIFAVWAAFTVSVLVLMEGLSAFLHTLRLHWVEFMSKFYSGLGYEFQPFSFKVILEEKEESDS